MKSFYKLFLLLFLSSITALHSNAAVTAAFISFENPTCFGSKDGFVTIDSIQTSGTTSPYLISVNTSPVTFFNVGDTVFGLGSGSFSITIFDQGDNTQLFPRPSFVINEPFQISTLIIPSAASCFDTCDGSARVLIGNGVSPFTIAWSDPLMQDSTTAIDLCNGEYFVTITDDNGCSVVDSVTITEPTQIMPNLTISDVSCFGFSDGSATSAPSGGSGTYSNFEWSSNATNNTSTESGLIAATYTVTVTDNTGCIGVESFIITEPAAPLSVSLSKVDVFCNGDSTGIINTARSGGTPPYTYTWSDGPSTERNRDSLSIGTYTVTVEDQNGCTETASETITDRPAFNVSFTQVNNDCNGDSTGSISVTILGATPAYSFDWSDSTSGTGSSSTISNLAAGTYTITITDALLCTYIDSVTITEPTVLDLSINSQSDPLCNSGNDGSIDIDVSGGTLAYTYNWNNGFNTEDISGLTAGDYTLTVTDANGCSDSISVSLGEPSAIIINTDSVSQVSCNGASDGFIRVSASGGSLNYTYTWPGPIVADSLSNLTAGTYTVTVTDGNSCTDSLAITISQPAALTVSLAITDEQCSGDDDGEITANPSGGTSPYTYSWNTFDITQTISNLVPGSYQVTVTDSNGCTATQSGTVDPANPIFLNLTKTDVTCNGGSDGVTNALATGGAGSITYAWSPSGTGSSVTNRTAGTYTVTATDGNSCTATQSIVVSEPDSLNPTITPVDVGCGATSNGSASVLTTGGTSPYTFNWGPGNPSGQGTSSITGLSAQTYTLTVTDANGCDTIQSFIIDSTSANFTYVDSVTNVTCFGDCNGSISINGLSGGTSPYTYTWNFAATGSSVNGLCAGTYTVVISDSNGCDSTASFMISEPDSITIILTTINESCSGNDGEADASLTTGGTPPYSYAWSGTTDTTSSIDSLVAGSYTLTITDSNNCQKVQTFAVGSDPGIDDRETITNVSCNGGSDGNITLSPSGGIAPYNFVWDDSSIQFFRNAISAGSYTVTITDNSTPACSVVESYVITEPDSLKPTLSIVQAGCGVVGTGSATVSTTGGTSPYTFNWGPGNPSGQGTSSITGLSAQTYTLTVTDSNGCDTIQSFTISSGISNFVFNDSVRSTTCFGTCDGFAGVFALSGGNPPYTFNWDNGSANSTRSNLCAGNYSLTISDATGCDSLVNFTVLDADSIDATILTVPDTCVAKVGNASVAVNSGGNGPYTFTWPPSGSASGSSVDSLFAGNYDLTITDATGCSIVKGFSIGNIAPFNIDITKRDISCNGAADGEIDVSAAGGTNPLTYRWSAGTSFLVGANPRNVDAGTYTLTLTDANGCAAVETVTVTEPDSLLASFLTVNDSSCTSAREGVATAITTGGTMPYTYNWGAGIPLNNTTSDLASGTYFMTVTDSNGCVFSDDFTIGSSAPFTLTYDTTDASCGGGMDGTITLTTTGAVAPLTYDWQIGSGLTGANPTMVEAGAYGVTVTDGTGCSQTETVIVGEELNIELDTTNIQDESCSPGSDGFAKVFIIGGVEPYSYQWSPAGVDGQGTDSIFNLSPFGGSQTYLLTVTDANGCSRTIANIVVESGSDIDENATVVRPTCFGDCDGSIRLSPTGGVRPYTYLWDDSSTDSTRSNLCVGNYQVTITDNATPPCTKVENITVNNRPILVVSQILSFVEQCVPGNDGSAAAIVAGGTPPYTYAWSSGNPDVNNAVFDLQAGTHTVTVTDANGCTTSEQFQTLKAPNPVVTTTSTNPKCNGSSDGTITVNTSQGSNPLTYNWTGGFPVGADPKNVPAGTYTITVIDLFGCEGSSTVTLVDEAPITDTLAITDESCTPGDDGAAVASPSGGTPPYTYTWPLVGTSSGNTISGLAAGTYSVTVTDDSLCSQVIPFTIGSSAPFSVTITTDSVTCHGGNDGSITVTTTAASPTFVWANLPAGANQASLEAGTYFLTVTDGISGCRETETIIVAEPDTFLSNAILTNVSCSGGGSDGAVDLAVSGGTPPYTYNWGGGISTEDRNNLSVGTYSVTVTDSKGCQFSESFTIIDEPSITVDLDSVNVTCNGGSDGRINLTTSSLNPTFNWSPSVPSPNQGNQINVSANTYKVTITDSVTGCIVVDSITVNQPMPIVASFTTTPASCSPGCDGDAVATVTGGTPAYTYQWPPSGTSIGNSVSGLCSGNYNLTITDSRGCSTIEPFTIGSSAPFNLSFTNIIEPNCFGDSTGQFNTNVTGATGTLSYAWDPPTLPNQANQVGLPSATYTVTVTDQGNGCTETATITINEPAEIEATATIVRESCSPGSDGEIDLTVSGGTVTGAYTYNWSSNASNITAEDQTALVAGTYIVTITDDNGCSAVDTFVVGNSAPFTVSVAKTDLDCFGDTDGTIDITTGGPISGTLSYTWDPPQANSPNLTGLSAGTYDLTITDSGNGCIDTRSITINSPSQIVATVVSNPESCSPGNDGSLTPTVTGGTSTGGVYIYNWSGVGVSNPSNKNQNNLAAGPYIVTITDDNGCTLVDTFEVGVTAPFDVDLDSTDVSCNGSSDGSILVSTSAFGPTYVWSSNTMAGNTNNPTGLAAGTYTVTVTEPSSGCSESASIEINEPGRLTATLTSSNSTCGNSDGSIQASGISGGTAPIAITWLDATKSTIGQTGSTATNLAAGTYFAALSDANNCTDTLFSQVSDDTGPTASISGTDASCSNSCDGTATVTSACLSTNCVIEWTNSSGAVIGNTANITALCPGEYFAEITDNLTNCITNLSITINRGSSILPNLSTTDNSCSSLAVCSGEATVNPSGGTSPYTFVWSGPSTTIIGQGTDSISSLCPGNYDLTITDANGCDTTLSFVINPRSIISPNATFTNETCTGANDGTISLSPSGGSTPYTYNWNPVPGNGQGVSDATGLSAQNYNVTITDASGCDTSITITISSGSFIYSIAKTDLSCNGIPDGTASVSIVGGSAGYSFNWVPAPGSGQGSANVSGLSSGEYKVTITSGAGCSAIDSVTINQSSPIFPNESFTDETCAGLCNGTIDLSATGGAGAPYTYTWSPVPPNGQGVASATGLCSGNYSITIADASACDTIISITIQGATSLAATVTTEDMSCNNISPCDGSASITLSGGTAPYTYNWSAGNVIGVDGDSVNTLCEGNYLVTVTDANGCSSIEAFNISAPPAITANFTSTNATCNVSDGSITVTASGGSGGFLYAWFDAGMNALGVTTPTISGIASGIYFVEITDNSGCSEQFSFAVSDDGGESVTTSKTDVTCFGGSDGTAKASYNCSDPACSVEWFDGTSGLSLGVTIDSVSNLSAGNYFVEVTNNSGCKTFENVIITQPDPFVITASVVDETCNGGCNGSISVGVTGGTGNISYNWGPGPLTGQGTNNISNLCSGNYSLTVTDDNNCDSVFNFTVGQPIAFSTSFSYNEANCSLSDGSITATVVGGTVSVDYDYQWFDGSNSLLIGETNATINNISAGPYILRVRDDNVCEERFTAVLGNTNGPTVVIDSTRDAGCFSGNDGAVFITATSNNNPLTYNWLPQGQTTEDIENLSAGTFIVEVTDALGCIGTDFASITSSDRLVASISTSDASCGQCNGEADISITGGTAPYTYLWSNGSVADTAGSLCGGVHSVVVTDANGCTITESISINTDGGPTGETITAEATSCASSCDGTVTVTPIGGTAPYTYLWQHNGATTNSLTGLCEGIYFLQISDVSGCSRNVRVDIDSPNEIIINDQVRGTACNATCDGVINLNVSGGSQPYTFTWGPTPQNDSNFIEGLCAGIYNVTVSDANGCSNNKTITISNNGNPIVAKPTITDANCFGTCDGSIVSNLSPSGSVSFRWFDDQGSPLAASNVELLNSICAGEYILETTSFPGGCKAYTSVIVGEPDSITISPSVVKNVSCAGSCDGEIFVSSQGGTLLFDYSWSDSQSEVPAIDLCAGIYTVTATDANGCTAVNSISLIDPPVLTVSISGATGLNCSSDCNASANANANGGVQPYDYSWSGGQTGPNPTNLCFGPNILTVTDATGCILMDTVNISATDTVVAQVPSNTLLCSNDSINLDGTAIGSTINTIGWYEDDTTTLITNSSDTVIFRPLGDYTFFFIVSNGSCSDTAEYTITLVESPMVGVPSPISIFKDEVANIEVTNQDPTYLYNWNPGTDLTDSTIAEPISSTRETRVYTLTVTDTNNCTYIDSVEVIYGSDIRIPSGFSPNGDGKNDVWRIDLLEEFPDATVQVYNRWGELLYEQANGYTEPWDGTYEGKALPIGTYYYVVDFKNSRFKTATGPITIVK